MTDFVLVSLFVKCLLRGFYRDCSLWGTSYPKPALGSYLTVLRLYRPILFTWGKSGNVLNLFLGKYVKFAEEQFS